MSGPILPLCSWHVLMSAGRRGGRFPRREDVERSNAVRMNTIDGREQIYSAFDGGAITDIQQRDKMLQNFMAPKQLVLKEGAQVRRALHTISAPRLRRIWACRSC